MIALSFLLALSACLLWTGAEGQSSGDLRLVARNGRTTSSLTAGRLEVYYNGEWGTVCDNNFGISEARVACRQLGFSDYLYYTNVGSSSSSLSRFTAAASSTETWFDSLNCFGSESRLINCASSIGVENCVHSEDVALYCLGNGALRFATSFSASSSASSGRLEVYYNREWGTVCDDSFGLTDANVACQQQGFPSASRYGRVGTLGYSQGTGTTWLDELGCTSSDLMLSTCSHNGFGNEDCLHSEDVAVICNTISSTDFTDFTSDIGSAVSGAVIAGIVIAVVVPLCCIGICVTIIVIAVCTGACAAGAASSGRRRNINVATTTVPAAATATVVTTTGTAATTAPGSAPPPYPGTAAYPTQPQAAPAPYPQQTGYPPQAPGGAGYPPYPAAPQQPPAAYPEEQKLELQQYPADPGYPPQLYPAQPYPTAGYPTAGYPPPTNQ